MQRRMRTHRTHATPNGTGLQSRDSIKLFGITPRADSAGQYFVAAALVIGGYAVLGGTMQVGTPFALIIYANPCLSRL